MNDVDYLTKGVSSFVGIFFILIEHVFRTTDSSRGGEEARDGAPEYPRYDNPVLQAYKIANPGPP